MNYDIALYIETEKIAESKIAGAITIRRNEGESALMTFTLITSSGVQDINAYTGKNVKVDVIADAGVYRLFTGKVDYPILDLINKRITFECSNNRKELINDLDVSNIGTWSEHIFNDPEDSATELEQRLKTTPKTLDFDVYGNYSVNDINPKASPDFTLQGADVFYRNPSVSVVSSSEIINNITLNFGHRYTRLRHRERRFRIGPDRVCDVFTGQALWVNVKEALDSIDGTGWTIDRDSIGYEYMPPSHWVAYCTAIAPFLWLNLNDPHIYVLNVYYNAAIRFAQTIVEEQTITVKAPQSIAQYGEKDKEITHSIDIDFDASEWESNEIYKDKDDLSGDSNDWYEDADGTDKDYEDAVKTAISIARTEILRSHRKNVVDFETPLFPTVELKHTVKVDSTQVVATGKVTSIVHVLDVANRYGSTALQIAFSTATGSQSDDTVTAPTRPSVPVVGEAYNNVVIEIPTVDDDIITPPIDDLSRQTQTVTGTTTHNVEIPNSTLTVTF